MPAESQAQQKAMAIALHNPEKLHSKNKNMLKMSMSQLEEFAKTKRKGLPKKKSSKKSSKKNPMKAEIAKVAKKRRGY